MEKSEAQEKLGILWKRKKEIIDRKFEIDQELRELNQELSELKI